MNSKCDFAFCPYYLNVSGKMPYRINCSKNVNTYYSRNFLSLKSRNDFFKDYCSDAVAHWRCPMYNLLEKSFF